MFLEVISPEKTIYSGEVVLVQLPGVMGSFEILKNHAPLMALIEEGKMKIIDGNRKMFHLDVNDGIVEVKDNQIRVLIS